MAKNEFSKKISFDEIVKRILLLLKAEQFSQESQKQYRNVFNQIKKYMAENEIIDYSSDVGTAFVKNYVKQNGTGESWERSLYRIIRVTKQFLESSNANPKEIFRCKTCPPIQLSEHFSDLLEKYLDYCLADGNKASTIAHKRASCGKFLLHLKELGCSNIGNMDAQHVSKACLAEKDRDSWSKIRLFLEYLFEQGQTTLNFSAVVPNYRLPSKLPVVYSVEEIHKFEDAIDINSAAGARDYAMLLLATRYGIRISDINKLTLSDLDFENNNIRLIQEKTEQELMCVMLPVVKQALKNYVDEKRPKSNSSFVFLRAKAPYHELNKHSMHGRVEIYFAKAGINTTEKRHGTHSLRSSLASSLINDGIPSEAVRKILGQESKSAIKHYARIDIENLRKCAIPVPEPSNEFARFLHWEVRA